MIGRNTEIDKQIEKIKELIKFGNSYEEIKIEQKILNRLLKKYIDNSLAPKYWLLNINLYIGNICFFAKFYITSWNYIKIMIIYYT